MAKGQGKGHALVDFVGRRFGRLVVVSRAPENTKQGRPKWNCLCDCGTTKVVIVDSLRNGGTQSCGCYNREQTAKRTALAFPDPRTKKPEYPLWASAKFRAKRDKLPFEITLEDIVIPTHCPVLGIELRVGCGNPTDCSPTIDKIVPALGYVPGNIQVISFRANSIKRDATAEELYKVARYVEERREARLMHQ